MGSQSVGRGALSLVRCGAGGQSFGLEMAWVGGIDRADRLSGKPGPGGLAGALTGGGTYVPVYRLSELLGIGAGEAVALPHVIVLNARPEPWGLLVDRVSQVLRVPDGRAAPLPAGLGDGPARYFKGLARGDEEMLLLLAPARFSPVGTEPLPGEWGADGEDAGLLGLPAGAAGGAGRLVVFSTSPPAPRERPVAFGLSITQVVEVVESARVLPVPKADGHVLGLAGWRDRLVPVVDLSRRLGAGPSVLDGQSRLVVARAASRLVAFPVRPGARVLQLPVPHRPCTRELPLEPARTRAVVELKGQTLAVPDMETLLA